VAVTRLVGLLQPPPGVQDTLQWSREERKIEYKIIIMLRALMQDGNWAHPPVRFIDRILIVACLRPCTAVVKSVCRSLACTGKLISIFLLPLQKQTRYIYRNFLPLLLWIWWLGYDMGPISLRFISATSNNISFALWTIIQNGVQQTLGMLNESPVLKKARNINLNGGTR
jgi:hypothetical protein